MMGIAWFLALANFAVVLGQDDYPSFLLDGYNLESLGMMRDNFDPNEDYIVKFEESQEIPSKTRRIIEDTWNPWDSFGSLDQQQSEAQNDQDSGYFGGKWKKFIKKDDDDENLDNFELRLMIAGKWDDYIEYEKKLDEAFFAGKKTDSLPEHKKKLLEIQRTLPKLTPENIAAFYASHKPKTTENPAEHESSLRNGKPQHGSRRKGSAKKSGRRQFDWSGRGKPSFGMEGYWGPKRSRPKPREPEEDNEEDEKDMSDITAAFERLKKPKHKQTTKDILSNKLLMKLNEEDPFLGAKMLSQNAPPSLSQMMARSPNGPSSKEFQQDGGYKMKIPNYQAMVEALDQGNGQGPKYENNNQNHESIRQMVLQGGSENMLDFPERAQPGHSQSNVPFLNDLAEKKLQELPKKYAAMARLLPPNLRQKPSANFGYSGQDVPFDMGVPQTPNGRNRLPPPPNGKGGISIQLPQMINQDEDIMPLPKELVHMLEQSGVDLNSKINVEMSPKDIARYMMVMKEMIKSKSEKQQVPGSQHNVPPSFSPDMIQSMMKNGFPGSPQGVPPNFSPDMQSMMKNGFPRSPQGVPPNFSPDIQSMMGNGFPGSPQGVPPNFSPDIQSMKNGANFMQSFTPGYPTNNEFIRNKQVPQSPHVEPLLPEVEAQRIMAGKTVGKTYTQKQITELAINKAQNMNISYGPTLGLSLPKGIPNIGPEDYLARIPKVDDFGVPIRWVKPDSDDTSDGLAKVTDYKTMTNYQVTIGDEIYVPVVDRNVLRRVEQVDDPVTIEVPHEGYLSTTADPAVFQVMKTFDLRTADDQDWLAYEVVIGGHIRPPFCDDEACHSRCKNYGCKSKCEAESCMTGCVGANCTAECVGAGCYSMCIGDGCVAKCNKNSCEARCRGKSCEVNCDSFGCRKVKNGNTQFGGGTFEEHYPQYGSNDSPAS